MAPWVFCFLVDICRLIVFVSEFVFLCNVLSSNRSLAAFFVWPFDTCCSPEVFHGALSFLFLTTMDCVDGSDA